GRYGFTSADDPLGSMHAHIASGGLAARGSVALGPTFSIITGPRAEIDWIAASAKGKNATSASGAGLSVAWELQVHMQLGAAFSAFAAIEGGVTPVGLDLRADDRSV